MTPSSFPWQAATLADSGTTIEVVDENGKADKGDSGMDTMVEVDRAKDCSRKTKSIS